MKIDNFTGTLHGLDHRGIAKLNLPSVLQFFVLSYS